MKSIVLVILAISSGWAVDANQILGTWTVNEPITTANYRKVLSDMLMEKSVESGYGQDQKAKDLIVKNAGIVELPEQLAGVRILFNADGSAISDYVDGSSRDVGQWEIVAD